MVPVTVTSADDQALTPDAQAVFAIGVGAASPGLSLPGSAAGAATVFAKQALSSPIVGITVNDTDSPRLIVTLVADAGDALAVSGADSLVSGLGTNQLSLRGLTADVNAALASLSITSSTTADSVLRISVSDDDSISTADPTEQILTVKKSSNTPPNAGASGSASVLGASAVIEDASPSAANVRINTGTLTDPDGTPPIAIRIVSVEGGVVRKAADGAAIALGLGGDTLAVSAGAVDLRFTPDANRDQPATIKYVVVDAALTSLTSQVASVSVPMQAVNDVPVLSGASAVSFIEGGAGAGFAQRLSVLDPDSANLSKAQIRLTNSQSGDTITVGTLDSGLTSASTLAGGVLTLEISGTASLAKYESALRALNFSNTSDDPSVADRLLEIRVWDNGSFGDSTAGQSTLSAHTVNVFAVNDAPTLSLGSSTVGYTEALDAALSPAAVSVFSGLSIDDPDSTTYAGARIAITTNYRPGQDSLEVAGTLPAGLIATNFDPSTGALTLSGVAADSIWEAALAQIVYKNKSDNPDTSARAVALSLTDAQGASSQPL
ncbi:MAG: hypothetical protein EBV35_08290, partial [Betaproteobacteria bacterium]|nr:hypothetical protein [Betaproteobacteria bacterium]